MHRLRLRHPLRWVLIGLPLLLVAALAVCEWLGWPFLQQPAERWLSKRLDRPVSFAAGEDAAAAQAGRGDAFRLHLLGSVRFDARRLQIDNPPWSTRQPMMVAHDAKLRLRWRDLMALRDGEPLRVSALTAERLQLQLQRRADGAASWHFGRAGDAAPGAAKFEGVHFERLTLRQGELHLEDAPLQLVLDGQASLDEGSQAPDAAFVGRATGRYHGHPLQASLRAGSALAGLSGAADAPPVPVQLKLQAGPSRLHFDGTASHLLGEMRLSGSYEVAGPSLAEVGRPLGLTLPTTGAFAMQGDVRHQGTRWHSVVHRAQVGRSLLAGEFDFDRPPQAVPTLVGRLRGPLLWLSDLGPAVGVKPGGKAAQAKAKGRVLPDRSFDLPSLKAMNADVRIDLERLEPGGDKLAALRPLRGRVLLKDGVLRIEDIDAQWAAGRVRGLLQVDGRQPKADWQARLSGSGLVMERWLRLSRKPGQPPYVTGLLGGQIELRGQGRSTAEFLATADGSARLHWTRGTISHLVVEGAGIDIAQALGVMIRGDKPLPVQCGAADLKIADGIVRPQVLLVDTPDSTIYGEGAMSLATERLALVAKVEPKDISPLALRTPIHVDGTLADPDLRLEKGPLARRLVPSALLAMLNPLAALLPLIDAGDDDAQKALAGCHALNERLATPQRRPPAPRTGDRTTTTIRRG